MNKGLLITIDYPPNTGGVARYLENYAGKHDLDVLASTIGYPIPNSSVLRRGLEWGLWPRWLPALFWGFWYGRHFDRVVVSHILPIGYVAYLLGKPYTVILHGLDIINAGKSNRKRNWTIRILNKADKIVVNSNATGKLLEKVFKKPYRFEVNYPVSTKLGEPTVNLKKELKLEERKVILSLGRLVKRKGQEMVIRAMPKILKKNPDAVFVIAGDGPYKKDLKKLVDDLKLGESVKFLGRVPEKDLPNIYSMCDVFVLTALPSNDNWEGFGIVCLEADSFGKPVIVSNTGGLPEAAKQCDMGYVINDEDELMEKILEVL